MYGNVGEGWEMGGGQRKGGGAVDLSAGGSSGHCSAPLPAAMWLTCWYLARPTTGRSVGWEPAKREGCRLMWVYMYLLCELKETHKDNFNYEYYVGHKFL